MILNRGMVIDQDGEHLMFDYARCFYPQGSTPEEVFYFNEENIDEVVFEGYSDGEEERYQKVFKDWKEKNEGAFKQGKVTRPSQS